MNKEYTPQLISNKTDVDYVAYAEEFETALRGKLLELFDPEVPFVRCEYKGDKSPCTYCDYKVICKR